MNLPSMKIISGLSPQVKDFNKETRQHCCESALQAAESAPGCRLRRLSDVVFVVTVVWSPLVADNGVSYFKFRLFDFTCLENTNTSISS